jgi:uncharacterized membrane protein
MGAAATAARARSDAEAMLALTPKPPPARAGESHVRSIAKAVSWRITGSIDTFVLALLFTGSGALAGSIAGTEIVTKIIIYYLHERVWTWVGWGRD